MTNININVIMNDNLTAQAAISDDEFGRFRQISFTPIRGGYIYTDAMTSCTHFIDEEDFAEKKAAMIGAGWKFVSY